LAGSSGYANQFRWLPVSPPKQAFFSAYLMINVCMFVCIDVDNHDSVHFINQLSSSTIDKALKVTKQKTAWNANAPSYLPKPSSRLLHKSNT